MLTVQLIIGEQKVHLCTELGIINVIITDNSEGILIALPAYTFSAYTERKLQGLC